MSEGRVAVQVAGQEIPRGGEFLADEAQPEEPGAHRVLRVLGLLGLGAGALGVLRHLAECEAKLDEALELACVDAVLPLSLGRVELEEPELDRLSEYSDKRSYPNKFFIRRMPENAGECKPKP